MRLLLGLAIATVVTFDSCLASVAAEAESLENRLLRTIAQAHLPNADGAMGRNRRDYIHVRFQYRAHLHAQLAAQSHDQESLSRFVSALEYAGSRQQADGCYDLQIPRYLAGHRASTGDLASGTAFFLASAGVGMLLLEDSAWFKSKASVADYRRRLDVLRPDLERATKWLSTQVATLQTYDRQAPNRLLINALAFLSLGRLSDDQSWQMTGRDFFNSALEQQHELGYFIEGGGYDSSYNGVALAVALRLLQLGLVSENAADPLVRSAQWQLTRVSSDGEIRTEGNARVHGSGESFMGKPKSVDVAHTVEAFLLASELLADEAYLNTAHSICQFYRCQ